MNLHAILIQIIKQPSGFLHNHIPHKTDNIPWFSWQVPWSYQGVYRNTFSTTHSSMVYISKYHGTATVQYFFFCKEYLNKRIIQTITIKSYIAE